MHKTWKRSSEWEAMHNRLSRNRRHKITIINIKIKTLNTKNATLITGVYLVPKAASLLLKFPVMNKGCPGEFIPGTCIQNKNCRASLLAQQFNSSVLVLVLSCPVTIKFNIALLGCNKHFLLIYRDTDLLPDGKTGLV